MKRLAMGCALLACLMLTGCGNQGTSVQEMREIAELRAECHALGGEFYQWTDLVSQAWRCDFDDRR